MALLCNIGVVIWLVLCHFASITPPTALRYIALFSLTTPFAIVANMGFVLFWLFSNSGKWFSLLSLTILLFCIKMIPAIFGYHYFSKNNWEKDSLSFKLMTWNVHAMGTFNSPHEKEHALGIVEVLQEEQPDILCIPEYGKPVDNKRKDYTKTIINNGHYPFFKFNVDNSFGTQVDIGTAIFSRYPIVHYQAHQLSTYIYLVEADIDINEHIVRFGVMHLHSFGLSDEDKAIIEGVKYEQNKGDIIKSRSFLWKFNEAYIHRAEEAEKARALIDQSPYPIVVCGDFNDLPFSYTYATIRGNLNDAFAELGRGLGRTYNQIVPTLRIDHLLYSGNDFKIKAFKTRYSDWSDHSAVIANFQIVNHKAN
ncbi:MAG: endonuclease/exonuclease/phosphatase family protein [Bacteroidetes bacterium]|nr:endonuclease/exonuclease/phosphatase family protein [Bacteroidota bacterium]MBS1739650.1 endonuclease/exonuclease/phosphatase family protein [Bacteroidota bacterium]